MRPAQAVEVQLHELRVLQLQGVGLPMGACQVSIQKVASTAAALAWPPGRLAAGEELRRPWVDRDRLLDLAVSRSNVAVLAPEERQTLLGQISALWDEEPALLGCERVKLAYLTRVRRARRLRRADGGDQDLRSEAARRPTKG